MVEGEWLIKGNAEFNAYLLHESVDSWKYTRSVCVCVCVCVREREREYFQESEFDAYLLHESTDSRKYTLYVHAKGTGK